MIGAGSDTSVYYWGTVSDPLGVFLVLEAARGLGLGLIVVAPIYMIQMAHFGPLELVLAGTALELAYFASEIPTGVVADAYSRKLSCVCGAFVMGAAWLLQGAVANVWTIMASSALLGVGWTFFSGAAVAWIAGELGEDRGSRAVVVGQQAHLGAMVVGGFAGAGLGAVRLNLPILAAGVSHVVLGGYLLAAMRETPGRHSGTTAELRTILIEGVRTVRRSTILLTILGAVFLAGMASEGLDRLWEAHLWANLHLPAIGPLSRLYWFAIISGVATALSVPALSFARRFVERESNRALAMTTIATAALVAAGSAVFGIAKGLLIAVVAYWAVRVGRNVADPAYTVWALRNSEPSVRATVLSIAEQSHSIGEIVSGPPLGLIGRLVSIPAALVASGIMQACALPLLARVAGRGADVRVELDTALPDRPGAEPLAPDL
jgi:DHA3 family tetracycline resistance protein-like MFS transporter